MAQVADSATMSGARITPPSIKNPENLSGGYQEREYVVKRIIVKKS
jgi:hypothetical protein